MESPDIRCHWCRKHEDVHDTVLTVQQWYEVFEVDVFSTSWGGMSKDTVLKSTFTKVSVQGSTKKILTEETEEKDVLSTVSKACHSVCAVLYCRPY